jgi:hypothetical protein
VDEPDTVRKIGHRLARDLQCQACLAAAARTAQREQAALRLEQALPHRGHLPFSADQRDRMRRQVIAAHI